MEANCFIFPSPKEYNLENIRDKILLIPKDPEVNYYYFYHKKFVQKQEHSLSCQTDQFGIFLKWMSIISECRSQKIIEEKKIENVLQTDSEIKEEAITRRNSYRKISLPESGDTISHQAGLEDYIPCLFIRGNNKKVVLFFHANGEDLTSCYDFLNLINFQTKLSILAMQYRGYSINKGEANPKLITEDALRVFKFLRANNIGEDQILVLGRSIGCAVALAVVEKVKVHSLTLLSPFVSVKQVAKDIYGSCAGRIIKEPFSSQHSQKEIDVPTLLIHGKEDKIVPYEHSLILMGRCQSYSNVKIVDGMTHTRFNFKRDFIRNFKSFIDEVQQNS